MRAKLTAHHAVHIRRMRPPIRTEPREVERAHRLVLDVPLSAVLAQRTESPRVMRTRRTAQRRVRRDVEVCAVIALRTDAVSGEFLAFSLVAEIEGMGEFAGFAFLAESSLVVFAD